MAHSATHWLSCEPPGHHAQPSSAQAVWRRAWPGGATHPMRLATQAAQASVASMVLKLTADCVQAHGGMGFTWDSGLHLYFKRARQRVAQLGSAAAARRAIARALHKQHSQPA